MAAGFVAQFTRLVQKREKVLFRNPDGVTGPAVTASPLSGGGVGEISPHLFRERGQPGGSLVKGHGLHGQFRRADELLRQPRQGTVRLRLVGVRNRGIHSELIGGVGAGGAVISVEIAAVIHLILFHIRRAVFRRVADIPAAARKGHEQQRRRQHKGRESSFHLVSSISGLLLPQEALFLFRRRRTGKSSGLCGKNGASHHGGNDSKGHAKFNPESVRFVYCGKKGNPVK